MNRPTLEMATPTDEEIVMTRVFAAPRQVVFEALTRPELLQRWFYGPTGWSMPVCEVDLRVGGRYRYEWRGPEGQAMAVGGTYQEIVVPERIVRTEVHDGDIPAGPAVSTTVLVHEDGITTLTTSARYESRDDRDAALRSGMDSGIATSYVRLASILTASSDEVAS